MDEGADSAKKRRRTRTDFVCDDCLTVVLSFVPDTFFKKAISPPSKHFLHMMGREAKRRNDVLVFGNLEWKAHIPNTPEHDGVGSDIALLLRFRYNHALTQSYTSAVYSKSSLTCSKSFITYGFDLPRLPSWNDDMLILKKCNFSSGGPDLNNATGASTSSTEYRLYKILKMMLEKNPLGTILTQTNDNLWGTCPELGPMLYLYNRFFRRIISGWAIAKLNKIMHETENKPYMLIQNYYSNSENIENVKRQSIMGLIKYYTKEDPPLSNQ